MPVDFLLDAVQLVGEGLPRVLALHGQHVLEGLLLAAKDLDLFFVRGEVLVQLAASLGQVGELALEMGRVLRSLHLTHGCLT